MMPRTLSLGSTNQAAQDEVIAEHADLPVSV
jgi:hypothetical protein